MFKPKYLVWNYKGLHCASDTPDLYSIIRPPWFIQQYTTSGASFRKRIDYTRPNCLRCIKLFLTLFGNLFIYLFFMLVVPPIINVVYLYIILY